MLLVSSSNSIESNSLEEALHYIRIHRYEKANYLINSLLSESPLDAQLLFHKAYCHFQLDEHNEAIEYCMEALNAGFSIEGCNELLGLIYMELDEYVKAEQLFLEVLRLNPQNVDVLAKYSSIMLNTGHEEKAKKLLDEALRLDPENELALHYSFIYFLAKNKKMEQMEALIKYLEVSNTEVRKYLNLGVMEYFKGNYKEAREQFRQAFLLDPTNNNLLELLDMVNRQSHILYLPQRAIEKVGGPAVVWLAFIGLYFFLRYIKFDEALFPIAGFYIALCIYTWITPLIAKFFIK